MTRNQFWILLGGAVLEVVLLIVQVVSTSNLQYQQARHIAAQQALTAGNNYVQESRQIATRIYQVSQQTQDPGLKELMTRQQIVVSTPAADSTAPAAAPATR